MIERTLAWLVLLACIGCGDGEELEKSAGTRADAGKLRVDNAVCLGCHATQKAAWQNPSSHRTLFACADCHTLVADSPGPGHASRPECAECHSETAHPSPSARCTSCHDQHGSENAFLIRSALTRPDGTTADVHFTLPEGESPDGLVHTGEQAGTGVCETCHTQTAHYLASGQGSAHYTAHCTQCHDHQAGFTKP